MSSYGRNRQSITDIEQELYDLFECHPDSRKNETREPAIPGNALVDIFRIFGERHDGVQLITSGEESQLNALLESHPGLEVTPQVLLGFIATRTSHSPTSSPQERPQDADDRGRLSDRDEQPGFTSRSSSQGSSGTSIYRPPSREPPKTPMSGNFPDSPFDNGRRQRSTPLGSAIPSSWNAKRPVPASRRKSDAGSGRASSDSESTPSSIQRHGPRSRAPSNPTSPYSANSKADLPWNSPPQVGSPPLHSSPSLRPHSRAQSQGQFNMNSLPGYHYGSSDYDSHNHDNGFDRSSDMMSPERQHADSSFDYHSDSLGRLSSLPIRRSSGSDSDSDGDDPTLGLVMDRSAASSLVSLAPQDRLDALQRSNAELGRKLMEAERTLQNKLSEHESELEEMQSRLEEAKSELSATKREEKELRAKERQNSGQIAALETEIVKMQKALDNARSSYQSLQKQYQEQCAESERYRNTLRRRDEELKDHQEQISLHSLEIQKWQQQREQIEAHATAIEQQLSVAREAQNQLDEQKQENLMLKETIDRMRFDMDELRNKAEMQATGSSTGTASAQGSISRSLGLEILRMNNGKWIGEEEDDDDNEGNEDTTIDGIDEGDNTEGEDVIQTIITRKTRKVLGRANKTQIIRVEDIREYSDAYTQHEMSEFTDTCATQTVPEPQRPTYSLSIQTEATVVHSAAIQTDFTPLPSPPVTKDAEAQTEMSEPSRSPTPDDEMTSSSSTVRPSTPKPASLPLKGDQPPSYSQVPSISHEDPAETENAQATRDIRLVTETLKKWHKGLHVPLEAVRGGLSDDAVEEWQALKDEIGFECLAIDKVMEMSLKTGQPRSPKDSKRPRKANRFYNIYNTFVYKDGENNAGSSLSGNALTQVLLLTIGISALGIAILTPPSPQYAMPGTPMYYDRHAWTSVNTMSAVGEGLSPDGTAAVWNFIGRVGGGAARIARGWPS